jgi:hypothetical protein
MGKRLKDDIFVATHYQDVERTLRFVYEKYVHAGLTEPNDQKIYKNGNGEMLSAFVVYQGEEITATCTIFTDAYLPCFGLFPETTELLAHNKPSGSFIEVGMLAANSFSGIMNMFRVVHRVGQILCCDVFAVVHPKHVAPYKKLLGFVELETRENIQNGHPGTLIVLPHSKWAAHVKRIQKWDLDPIPLNADMILDDYSFNA